MDINPKIKYMENNILTIIGCYATLFWVINWLIPNTLPNSIKELFISFFDATPKASRIIYPFLILLLNEPQAWWKVLLIVVTLEVYFLIAKPTADLIFRKFGY